MDKTEILALLQNGVMEVEGLLPWSSNYTFLVRICHGLHEVEAVYKPRRGERPLWDFASGTLCQRERAAFLVSEAIGWDLVPPTVLRPGPNGIGSVQLFIPHDPERHYFTIEGNPAYRQPLQKITLLDILLNNADRKGGHVLLAEDEDGAENDQLWAIDHGICFHADYKLRTVIWEFAGQPIPPQLRQDLACFQEKVLAPANPFNHELSQLLSDAELLSFKQRLAQLNRQNKFATPGPRRHYPWPPV